MSTDLYENLNHKILISIILYHNFYLYYILNLIINHKMNINFYFFKNDFIIGFLGHDSLNDLLLHLIQCLSLLTINLFSITILFIF